VHDRTDRNPVQRQRVAHVDLGVGAALNERADREVPGGEDVALLAVVVVQRAMFAERFGSYSMAATVAGTPSLRRLKSM
jgi:hypothetical protein